MYLWFILVFPWGYFDINHIRIIEPSILISGFYLLLHNKAKIKIDSFGKSYFTLICLAGLYTFLIPLFRTSDWNNIGHRIHLFIFMVELFIVYLFVYNIFDKNKIIFNKFYVVIISLHFILTLLYCYVGFKVQLGALIFNISAYTQNDNIENSFYISNGIAWSFLITNSIMLGYFSNQIKTIRNIPIIIFLLIIPILVSYFNMSRSAIVLACLISILFLVGVLKNLLFQKSSINRNKITTAFSLVIIVILLISVTQKNALSKNFVINNVRESIESKDDSSPEIRYNLVIDSFNYGLSTFLLGGGIGHIDLDKSRLDDDFRFLKKNSPQNTYASIFIELGILGLILFVKMFYIIIKRITKYKFFDSLQFIYLKKSMIFLLFALLCSFFILHHGERSFTVFGPFVIITALFNKYLYQLKYVINPKYSQLPR